MTAKSNELKLTRIYDAPVKAVWDAWTDPKKAAKWWGPRGFTITTHAKDFRPGGHWAYTMHGPDGTEYPNKTLYLEIEKHRRLVYDHGGNDDRPPMFRVTVLFSETDGKTKMEMTMALPNAEAAEQAKKFIKHAGGNATWDRLAEYLAHESGGRERFVINRTFEAPIATLYEMWTKAEHLSQWLPPKGFTMKHARSEIKPGASTFWSMTDGTTTMYGHLHYLELRAPDRLVYTQDFADATGALARHPHAPTWPASMLTTVTFVAEAPNRTRVTVEWEPHGTTTPEELATFVAERAGMTEGWTGSFDKLDALIGGSGW